jgi:S1-C subfamily serine protease
MKIRCQSWRSSLRFGHAHECAGALFLTVLFASPSDWAAPGTEVDIRRDATVEAVEKVMPSVVNIGTKTRRERRGYLYDWWRDMLAPFYQELPPQESAGSGVIIDEAGFVLTNVHVVEDANEIWVRVGDRVIQADLVAGTRKTDVALLKLRSKPGEKFKAARFAADDDLLLGETVLALGNPFGLGGSVSRGILSAKTRRPAAEEGEPLDVPDWLQTDAAINFGNSGGPLVNLRGEVIGINVAILREGHGIGFAIPIKRVSEALSEIFTPEELAGLWFGARVKAGARPLLVTEVMAGSPAEKAGLRTADSILAINGQPVRSFIEFTREVIASGDQRPVTLLVRRGAERHELTVRSVPESSFFNAELIRRKIGVVVEELEREQGSGRRTQVAGLLVTGVDHGSPAARANLQPHFILEAIDGRPATDVTTAAKILYAKKKAQKAELALIIPRQRGNLTLGYQTTVEVTVR